MCGYAFYKVLKGKFDLTKLVEPTFEILKNRGPDCQNYYFNELHNELFCHARLEIIGDQSNGSQPAVSENNSSVLLFNGAIYNYKTLNPKIKFKSDTDALLHHLETTEVRSLSNLDGMFTFLYRNYSANSLVLARDLAGQKPLYYATLENRYTKILCVVSDLRCIVDNFNKNHELKINQDTYLHYKRYGFSGNNETLFENIYEVPPNCALRFMADKFSEISFEPIYSNEPKKNKNSQHKFDFIGKLDNLLDEVVRDHLIADQDIGLLLSGGIDSSLISSYAVQNSAKPLNAFTIKFSNAEFDESQEAADFARKLGVTHCIIDFPTGYKLVEIIENALGAIDHPFCDLSALPTFALTSFISGHNKVVLTGDGGDEMFAGYNRHVYQNSLAYKLLPRNFVEAALPYTEKYIPERTLSHLRKVLVVKSLTSAKRKYEAILAQNAAITHELCVSNKTNFFDNEFLNLDFCSYLPGLVLKKVDRMSMANGIECRAPFLSEKILRFSQVVSFDEKIASGSKSLLRELHAAKFPRNSNGKKKGFSVSASVFDDKIVIDWLNSFSEKCKEFDDGRYGGLEKSLQCLRENKRAKVDANLLWNQIVLLNWLQTNNVKIQ